MSEPADKVSIKSIIEGVKTTLGRVTFTPLIPLTILASLPLLSIILAVSFQGPFADALSIDHTYRVMLITGMLVVILWATELTLGAGTPKHKAWWLIISWLLVVAAVVFLGLSAWEYCELNYCEWRAPSKAEMVTMIGSFIFFGLLVVALIYRMLGFDAVAPDDSPKQLRLWGQLAVFGVMVLALFAFGIEVVDFHLQPKWAELPAILIVFVLAELGVHLVTKAEAVRKDVTTASQQATDAAKASVEAVKEAERVSKESIDSARDVSKGAMASLQESGAIAKIALTQLNDATKQLGFSATLLPTALKFMQATDIEETKFWKTLVDFIRSWIGDAGDLAAGGQTRKLVGSLYCQFVEGPGGKEGTIRAEKGEVSCVTIDTVYAHVAMEWLRQHANGTKPRVVVWALTSLLPTDFAAPQLWWTPERDEKTHRVRTQRVTSLEQFIGEVLTACGPDTRVEEYHRVTVLRKSNVDPHSVDTAWELAKDGASLRDVDRESNWDGLHKCLNQWFIWDPRALPKLLADTANNCIDYALTDLASRVRPNTVAPVELGVTPFQSDMFAKKFKEDWNKCKKQHILPELPTQKSFMFFKDITPTENNARYFVAHRDLMATKCPVADIRATVGRLDRINGAESGSATFEEVARSFGWITLKEWYCSKLHKAPGNIGAWWTEIDAANQLDALALQWDEFTWNPLDLLLIGERTESGDDVDWTGGAISNLRFDDPTCIVKLVTETAQLKSIAQVVKTLTNNFSSFGADTSHGTWDVKL